MNEEEFEGMLSDIAARYSRPVDLWHDENLSHDQKIQALRQWELDLRLIQVAKEENMQATKPDRSADILQEVHTILEATGAIADEQPSSAKVGGGGDIV